MTEFDAQEQRIEAILPNSLTTIYPKKNGKWQLFLPTTKDRGVQLKIL